VTTVWAAKVYNVRESRSTQFLLCRCCCPVIIYIYIFLMVYRGKEMMTMVCLLAFFPLIFCAKVMQYMYVEVIITLDVSLASAM